MWEIVHMLQDFGSSEELVAETQLSAAQVRLAVAYRDAYPDEIADAVVDNTTLENMRPEFRSDLRTTLVAMITTMVLFVGAVLAVVNL